MLVLTSLADGPKHGYALMTDIKSFSGVVLGPGSLYGCIARLERRGLIERLPSDDRRHPYRMTAAGSALLKEQLGGARRLADIGLTRLAEGMA